jgi:hypothetical protein
MKLLEQETGPNTQNIFDDGTRTRVPVLLKKRDEKQVPVILSNIILCPMEI